ncbi:tyrosine-type recombinase/integrase [Chloroflexota bacterium]
MFFNSDSQGLSKNVLVDNSMQNWIDAFIIDRKSMGITNGTLYFYKTKFKLFLDYCKEFSINDITQITPTDIRRYLLFLEDTGHNPGGRHCAYRVIRTFLYWYEDEVLPEGWINPIRKVKAPIVPIEPIEPVSIETIQELIKVCKKNSFTGDRDIAIILCLLDTGARANEFLNMDIEDLNQATGDILIRQGKGRKPRSVFIGNKSRRALRKYLRYRSDDNPALWITESRFNNVRISYGGLRSIIRRRSKEADVATPSLHDFRRAFALSMLRNGIDIFTLAKLMGHEGITVLQRYLKQTNRDVEEAHRRAGPVDNAGL